MNIYSKITEIRNIISDADIKKSGDNDFAKFKYYELCDYIDHLLKAEKGIGVCHFFNISKEEAVLTVINTEKPEETVSFSLPITNELLNTQLAKQNQIQVIGSLSSYFYRYLTIRYIDLVDNDIVDSTEMSAAQQSRKSGSGNNKQQAPAQPPIDYDKAYANFKKQILNYRLGVHLSDSIWKMAKQLTPNNTEYKTNEGKPKTGKFLNEILSEANRKLEYLKEEKKYIIVEI